MDRNDLVALVTQLVLEELAKPGAGGGAVEPDPLPPTVRRVLICGCPGSACEQAAWDALSHFTGTHWVVVDWPAYPAERVLKGLGRVSSETVVPPELWDDVVRNVDAVMLPFAPLDILAKLSQLNVDVPPVAAAVAAAVQGTPLLVGSDDCVRLTRHSARIPRTIISIAQEYGRVISGMGAKFETPTQLVAQFTGGVATLVSSPSGGRDIVTNEDVMAAVQAGNKVIDVSAGSIVTSLARETAAAYGIEVRFR